MDIEHLGPSLIDQLVDTGLVTSPADLYTLTAQQLAGLERMADKSAANVVNAIAASRQRPLDRLLSGLGIPMVGEVAARLLAKRYGTLKGFVDQDPAGEREALAGIHGIGDKMAESVAAALEDETFLGVIRKLLELGVNPAVGAEQGSKGPLSGQSFCVTGTLTRPRSQIHDLIKQAGGDVHKSVKRGTTYLVTGQKVGQKKMNKARDVGAEVIDETALFELLAAQDE